MDYILEEELVDIGVSMLKSLADKRSTPEDRLAAYHTLLELLSPYKEAKP